MPTNPGLGYLVDLRVFDQMIGVQNPYDSTVDVFSDRGTWVHLLLGAFAAYLGDGWTVGIASTFGGYELAKLSSGESAERIAGSWIEFGLGALLVALLRRYGRC
jgi:hypothetical protein